MERSSILLKVLTPLLAVTAHGLLPSANFVFKRFICLSTSYLLETHGKSSAPKWGLYPLLMHDGILVLCTSRFKFKIWATDRV